MNAHLPDMHSLLPKSIEFIRRTRLVAVIYFSDSTNEQSVPRILITDYGSCIFEEEFYCVK